MDNLCFRVQISNSSKNYVDISFCINSSLALVGESGSGKSLTLKAILGLLPAGFYAKLDFNGDFKLQRGKSIAYVPQNPFTALSPLTKIKNQWIIAQESAKEAIRAVGLDSEILMRFPPELSGGQLQRVVIAMALAAKPKLLLLDEPTTALDADLREMIVELLLSLQLKYGFKMLFVTHDIATATKLCEDIVVIKDGRVVENGQVEAVLNEPKSVYTKELIEANFANREFRR